MDNLITVNGTTGEIVDSSLLVPVSPFEMVECGLVANRHPTQQEAEVFGTQLFHVKKHIPWFIGDYCNLVDNYLDESVYVQLIDLCDIDYRTLQNWKSVAARVPLDRRREGLYWSHHEAVASLPEDDQTYWLDFAETHSTTVGDLRLMLRPPKELAEESSVETQQSGRWLDKKTVEQLGLLIDEIRDTIVMPDLNRHDAIILVDRVYTILIGDEYDEDPV